MRQTRATKKKVLLYPVGRDSQVNILLLLTNYFKFKPPNLNMDFKKMLLSLAICFLELIRLRNIKEREFYFLPF